jgi:RND family efflux transporter MFP subunit
VKTLIHIFFRWLAVSGLGISCLCCASHLKLHGFLEGEDYLVASPVPGQVEKILAREGERVASGQSLATINAEELNLHLKNAQAALSVLNSELERARTTLNRLPKGNPLYARMKEVYEVGGISRSQLNQAAGAGNDNSLRSQAELLVKELESEQAKAEAKLDELKSLASKTTLTSPASGIISKRYIQEGQRLASSDPAFLITQINPMYLKGSIPEKETAKIKWGQKVEVAPETLKGKSWVGELIQIENQPEFKEDDAAGLSDLDSNRRRVKIRLENPGEVLKPGMEASATLQFYP